MARYKRPPLIEPTDEEDAAITAAAESDPDALPFTDEEMARMRPLREVFPDMVRRRGPQRAETKVPVHIRLDREVVDHFKGDQPAGWQRRVNAALRKAAGLD